MTKLEDSPIERKARQIIKLGAELKIYNKVMGVCLKRIDSVTFRISLGNAGVNWVEDINIDKIEVTNG